MNKQTLDRTSDNLFIVNNIIENKLETDVEVFIAFVD